MKYHSKRDKSSLQLWYHTKILFSLILFLVLQNFYYKGNHLVSFIVSSKTGDITPLLTVRPETLDKHLELSYKQGVYI